MAGGGPYGQWGATLAMIGALLPAPLPPLRARKPFLCFIVSMIPRRSCA